jgi:excinuclease ABC subunit A
MTPAKTTSISKRTPKALEESATSSSVPSGSESAKSTLTPAAIVIHGAKTHTLKNISCSIPKEKLTVITGPSGSGKSSLAFDTLYAEGQRHYLESLNSYARQFFQRLSKPPVDRIDYLLPAIALEQKNPVKNARSTVGTATGAYDALRYLLAYAGEQTCGVCGSHRVGKTTPEAITRNLMRDHAEGTRMYVIAPVSLKAYSLLQLSQMGYSRVVQPDGSFQTFEATTPVDDLLPSVKPKKKKKSDASDLQTIPLLLDRLALKADKASQQRLTEALRQAGTLSGGPMVVRVLKDSKPSVEDPNRLFQLGYTCHDCGAPAEEVSPAWFSFNHPLHACSTCEGYGRVMGLDPDRIIPNKQLSLAEGAVHPFQTPSNQELQELLLAEAFDIKRIPVDIPYADLTPVQREFVWQGGGTYPGIRPFFEWLESKRYKVHVRVMLAKYRAYTTCPTCHGSRVKPKALLVKIGGKTLQTLLEMPVSELSTFLENHPYSEEKAKIAKGFLADLQGRLNGLTTLGIGHLSLGRPMRTLSGGEAQRVRLNAALGVGLTETLYVLDEPTVGLHARDTEKLAHQLKALSEQGNTVVVVEHDPDLFAHADHLIDMGPGSGKQGGSILYEGDWQGLLNTDFSLTAQAVKAEDAYWKNSQTSKTRLTDKKPTPSRALAAFSNPIKVVGATGHHLKNLTLEIPKNQWVCITGVSGSGKSSLIQQTLYANYLLSKGELPSEDPLPCQRLEGLDGFESVLFIDSSLPSRSTRSNPATYLKVYDEIRALFAQSPKALALGLTASDFSFNSAGGRCERCQGLGTITIDMQFMADVTLTCPDCDGKRFTQAVLGVELFGQSINDVLNLSVDEAYEFFKTHPKIHERLQPLRLLGLGYLTLGQTTETLSGGEAQRLKLAPYLLPGKGKQSTKQHLFLFNEPTVGLHLNEIPLIEQAFRRLLEAGHSLVVVEHHLSMIARCDWVIDLGPEAGDQGGSIVVEGPPETVMQCSESWTGRYLSQMGLPS